MADLGIARMSKEAGVGGTLTRADLSDTVHRELGLAPKPLSRLLRFERALDRLRAGAELADVALDSGYYDQGHLNRDFKQFTGRTPTEYLVASAHLARSAPPATNRRSR